MYLLESMIGDFMKFFKFLALVILFPIMVLLSGCGNTSMLEEYSFGYTQLTSEQSEVFLLTPFQLAHANRQSGNGYMYVGSDAHINLMAVAESTNQEGMDKLTPKTLEELSQEMLKKTTDISNLQTKVSDTTIKGSPAVIVENTYDEPLNGKKTSLVVRSLFFEDNDQVWHVMYMYKSGDAMGKEVTDHIFGKIK